MSGSAAKHSAALGFLTVVDDPQQGLFGGYLVLNLAGRPLEFHCTAPVKPNRAQQILYGPTLEPYLYGEQIGQTLASKGSRQPGLICTDLPAVLALREHTALPVALVLPGDQARDGAEGLPAGQALRSDPPHALAQPALTRFAVGGNRLAVDAAYAADQPAIAELLTAASAALDLLEPFARIREAIEEAQRATR